MLSRYNNVNNTHNANRRYKVITAIPTTFLNVYDTLQFASPCTISALG